MSKPLFHSFYSDQSLITVKHALFYYGEIAVPEDTFISISGENNEQTHYVQLLNENVYEHFEFLKKEEKAELVTFPSGTDIESLHQAVLGNESPNVRRKTYSYNDVLPIFKSLGLDIADPNNIFVVNQVAHHVAVSCLASIIHKGYLPCVDNVFISDLIAVGLETVSNQYLSDLTPIESKQLNSRLFAQHVYGLYLPTFKFETFHDVLELRECLSGRIKNLNTLLLELSNELDCSPWDTGFDNEVKKLIDKNIKPEIKALSQKAKYSFSNVAKEVAGAAIAVSLQSVLPETVANWLVGASSLSVSQAVKNERNRVNALLNNNAFGVLLEIDYK